MEEVPQHIQTEISSLRLAVEELSLLNEIVVAISLLTDVAAITDLIVSKCTKKVKAEQGCVLLISDDDASPFKTFVRKIDRPSQHIPIHVSTNLMGWMMKNEKPLVINDLSSDARFPNLAARGEFKSLLMVPLKNKTKLIGLFCLFNKEGEFNPGDQRLLSIIAFQSAQIIENARLAGKEKELQEMEKDLMVAREIQINLLPKVMPEVSGFDIYGASIPSKQVGGDYFDFIKLPNEHLGVVIGDVSGKGTPAAFLMANLQATIRSQALSSGEPKVLVKNSNSLLNQSMEQGKFVTLVYGRLNPSDKSFSYVNAGHNSPYLFSNGRVEELKAGGLILGVMPGVEYQQGSVSLKPKDLLVLFTDGVTEANNETDAFFEDERLLQVIKSDLTLTSKQLAEKIIEEVRHFQGMQSQSDDITLVVIRAI